MPYNATTLRGTPTYGAGKFGQALTGGVLAVPGSFDSTAGTLSAWVKTTQTSGTKVAVGADGSSNNGTWIGIQNGNAVYAPSGDSIQSSTIGIADGAWHHLLLVMTANSTTFYVDGSKAAGLGYNSAGKFTLGGGTFAIGGFGANSGYDWVGAIDEVEVSTAIEASGPFTPPTAASSPTWTTQALFHLDGDGTDATGSSGGGSSGGGSSGGSTTPALAPGILTAVVDTPSSTCIKLSQPTAPSGGTPPYSTAVVLRSFDNSNTWSALPVTSLPAWDSEVAPRTPVRYKALVIDSAGASAWTGTASATTTAPTGSQTRLLVCGIDSKTNGYGSSPQLGNIADPVNFGTSTPAWLGLLLGDGWDVQNVGIDGQTVPQAQTANREAQYLNASKYTGGQFFLLFGACNDLRTGSTASQAYAALKAYCVQLKAAGWQVIIATQPDNVDPSSSYTTASQDALNGLIRAGWSSDLGCVALCDYAASNLFGLDGTTGRADHLNYWWGGDAPKVEHYNDRGYLELAKFAAGVIGQAAYPAASNPSPAVTIDPTIVQKGKTITVGSTTITGTYDPITGNFVSPGTAHVQAGTTFKFGGVNLTGIYDPITGNYSDPGAAHVDPKVSYVFAGQTITGTMVVTPAPSGPTLQQIIGGVHDLLASGVVLASNGLDSIIVESEINARQALAPILAATAGVVAGVGSGPITIKGGNSSITRITATTDNAGNRSSVTLNLPV